MWISGKASYPISTFICEFFRNQKPSECGYRVRGLARRIGDGNAKVVGHVLRGTGSGCADGSQRGLHENARGIFHVAVRDFIRFGVSQFHVTDRVRSILDGSSNAFAALATETHGPDHGATFTHLRFPLIADLGKIIGPAKSCATALGTVHDHDIVGRKADALICTRDCRIVPFGNFSEVDSGKSFRGKVQLRGDTGNIVKGNHRAHHGWKMKYSRAVFVRVGLELLVIHRAIGSAEVYGAFGDLLDAATGTDGLVIDRKIGVLLVVLVKPLGVHGVRKCGAGTGDRERIIRPQNSGYSKNYQEHSCDSLHS